MEHHVPSLKGPVWMVDEGSLVQRFAVVKERKVLLFKDLGSFVPFKVLHMDSVNTILCGPSFGEAPALSGPFSAVPSDAVHRALSIEQVFSVSTLLVFDSERERNTWVSGLRAWMDATATPSKVARDADLVSRFLSDPHAPLHALSPDKQAVVRAAREQARVGLSPVSLAPLAASSPAPESPSRHRPSSDAAPSPATASSRKRRRRKKESKSYKPPHARRPRSPESLPIPHQTLETPQTSTASGRRRRVRKSASHKPSSSHPKVLDFDHADVDEHVLLPDGYDGHTASHATPTSSRKRRRRKSRKPKTPAPAPAPAPTHGRDDDILFSSDTVSDSGDPPIVLLTNTIAELHADVERLKESLKESEHDRRSQQKEINAVLDSLVSFMATSKSRVNTPPPTALHALAATAASPPSELSASPSSPSSPSSPAPASPTPASPAPASPASPVSSPPSEAAAPKQESFLSNLKSTVIHYTLVSAAVMGITAYILEIPLGSRIRDALISSSE